MESMKGLKRTQGCGALSEDQVGETVVLMGWVARRHDLGGLIFVDVRDASGISQVVFDAAAVEEADFLKAEGLRAEYVIAVRGRVKIRDEETINRAIATGTVEVRVEELRILSEAKTPPFPLEEADQVNERLRLEYRYLDLRRSAMQQNLRHRQEILRSIRERMEGAGFLEIETPTLTRSTPEGARDYLVPSRVTPGAFYALPQSPQIYKQLLMVSSVDRYYQVARCYRDEDLRADRQPEFTQVDMEMLFIDEEEILTYLETLFREVVAEFPGKSDPGPFPRLTYGEAIDRYGSDKPDLRFDLPIVDLSDLMHDSGFAVFDKVVTRGGVVRAINLKGKADMPRRMIEDLTEETLRMGGDGMAWIAVKEDGSLYSVITKFFDPLVLEKMLERLDASPGDFLIFSADERSKVSEILGQLRLSLADHFDLRRDEEAFCMITDFPLFEWDEEKKGYQAMHHPFTMVKDEDLSLLDSDPLQARAKAYDVVLNGVELGSGSIRIHDGELQARIFDLLGLSKEIVEERFGFLLKAFQYGTPPHGGFAFGLDRLVMLLVGAKSLREVIAFPKMRDGSCAMMETPGAVSSEQLEALGLSRDQQPVETEDQGGLEEGVVRRVAELANLALTPDEEAALMTDLNEIIGFADRLMALDTHGVPPRTHVLPLENVLRPDVERTSLTRDEVFANAPEHEADQFFIPRVLEG